MSFLLCSVSWSSSPRVRRGVCICGIENTINIKQLEPRRRRESHVTKVLSVFNAEGRALSALCFCEDVLYAHTPWDTFYLLLDFLFRRKTGQIPGTGLAG